MKRFGLTFLAALALLGAALAPPARAANEIKATDAASKTVYAVVISASGQFWNGTALAAYADANWATYAVTMAEQGTSQNYFGTFPTLSAGRYSVEVFERAGASPATADTLLAQGSLDWTGSAVASLAAGVTVSGYALGQSPDALLLAHTVGHGMTVGQILVALQAVGAKVAAASNSWNATTHVLTTTYTFTGDAGATLTTQTQYPSTQTTAPPVATVTATVGTIPQP